MLCIKTGMDAEYNAVTDMLDASGYFASDIKVLKGIWTEDSLATLLGSDCEGIISVGLCGGLCPGPKPALPLVGKCYLAGQLVCPAPDKSFSPDMVWTARLAVKTKAEVVKWWSSGQFNTADDVSSRTAIWQTTGAEIIDDESYAVAQFAAHRGIPFAIARVVSDTCTAADNIPPAARNALTKTGGVDIFEVIVSVLKDMDQLPALERIWHDYNTALASLRLMLHQAGPWMQLFDRDVVS